MPKEKLLIIWICPFATMFSYLLKSYIFINGIFPYFSIFLAHVLKVSYCDRLLSVVRHASSVNFFSSVTSGSNGMKLHRKHPLNDLTRFPSNLWDPCRILVSMATKWTNLQNSSPPKLVDRFSNNYVEMFLGWPSIRFLQAMLIGWKLWPPGGRGLYS